MFAVWLAVGMRNLGADVSMADFAHRRQIRRLMRENCDYATDTASATRNDAQQPPQVDFRAERSPESENRSKAVGPVDKPMRRFPLLVAISIILAGVMISGAILFGDRWQIASAPGGIVHRLDRWTGEVAECAALPGDRYLAHMRGIGLLTRCYPLSDIERQRILSSSTSSAHGGTTLPTADELLGPERTPKP